MSFLSKLVGADVRRLILFTPFTPCRALPINAEAQRTRRAAKFFEFRQKPTELFGTLDLLRETLRSLRLCVYSQIGLETPHVVSYKEKQNHERN